MRAFAGIAVIMVLAGCTQADYKRPASAVWAYRIDEFGAIVYWPSEGLCDAARGHRAPCRRAIVTDGGNYWAVTLYGRAGEHGWAFTTRDSCERVTQTSSWEFRYRTRCAPVSVRFEE